MARFRFPLEVVRRLRRQARDAQLLALARASSRVMQSDAIVQGELSMAERAVEQSRFHKRAKRIDLAALRVNEYYGAWLAGRIAQSTSQLQSAEIALADERTKLAAATATLKAIEKLREKHWVRFTAHLCRVEQAESDEFASMPNRVTCGMSVPC